MKYKLAIFDMDGTILDTLDDLTNSLNFSLEKSGYPARTTEQVRSFVGNGILKLIERGVPTGTDEESIKKVFDDFSVHYKLHCSDNTKAYKGITELFKTLGNNNVKIAIVSNKADFAVQELCVQYFDNLYDYAVGEKEGIRKKPAPDSVNTVMKYLNTNKSDTVYIGDSEVDIETAKNADIDCISVDWGFREHDYLIKMGASVIVSDVMSLEKAL